MSFIEELQKKYENVSMGDLVSGKVQEFTYEYVLFLALSKIGVLKRAVPLEDIHLFNALTMSLLFYSKHKPAVAVATYYLGGGTNRFVVPSDRYVIKVEPNLEFSYEGDMYNSNEFILFTRLQAPMNLRRYTIIQQWINTARQLFNPEKYFLVRKETVDVQGVKRNLNVLYLHSAFPSNTVNVYFTKSWEIEDLPYFPQEDRNFFVNYVSEKIKYLLGEIYSALGDTLPGEQASFNLNGTSMKTEAQAALEKLETELIQSAQKTLPIYG